MTSHQDPRQARLISPALLIMAIAGCVPTLGGEPPDEGKGRPTTEPAIPDEPDQGPDSDEPCEPDGCEEEVPTPNISLDQLPRFPLTLFGDTSYQPAVIRNLGKAPLHIRAITMEGDPELTVEPSGGVLRKLLYQETMTIALYYNPNFIGHYNHSTALIIESDDPVKPRHITGLRARAAMRCFASPAQVDFGPVQAGQEEERTITLKNCAEVGKITIEQLALEQDGADFSLLPSTLAEELPLTLNAGGQRPIKVHLAPSPDRPMSDAILRIDHDAGTERIPLSAQVFERLCPIAHALATTERTLDAPSDTLTVFVGEPFTLDASSSQPAPQDNSALIYGWRLLAAPAGSTLKLTDKGAQRLEDMIPDLPGDYVFELRVAQPGIDGCAPALVTIHAEAP